MLSQWFCPIITLMKSDQDVSLGGLDKPGGQALQHAWSEQELNKLFTRMLHPSGPAGISVNHPRIGYNSAQLQA
jgi:hypothetical protein